MQHPSKAVTTPAATVAVFYRPARDFQALNRRDLEEDLRVEVGKALADLDEDEIENEDAITIAILHALEATADSFCFPGEVSSPEEVVMRVSVGDVAVQAYVARSSLGVVFGPYFNMGEEDLSRWL